jgi:hypothetical protein
MADDAIKLFWLLIWQRYAASHRSYVALQRYTTQGLAVPGIPAIRNRVTAPTS